MNGTSSVTEPGPIARSMREKLESIFAPIRLTILDESSRHAGHAGAKRDDGGAGETHFRVEIVSAAFNGMKRVARERSVQKALAAEIEMGVHALSVKAMAPGE
ncbi:MAG: BolA family protein [Caulobacterales bacterium]